MSNMLIRSMPTTQEAPRWRSSAATAAPASVVDEFLDEIAVDGETKLTRAIQANHIDQICSLLAVGASPTAPNLRGVTPMGVAFSCDNTEAVRMLQASGASAEPAGLDWTPLLFAAVVGAQHVAQMFLEGGADINHQESAGNTPLMAAAGNGHTDFVRMLLASGADATICNRGGSSALQLAARYDRPETVDILIRSGVDPDPTDSMGRPLLMRVAGLGHTAVVRILAAAGAQIDARDPRKRTALMLAAERGHADVVRALCELGAGVFFKDESGRTAEQMATPRCRALLRAVREHERLSGGEAPGGGPVRTTARSSNVRAPAVPIRDAKSGSFRGARGRSRRM